MIITRAMPTQQTAITGVSRRITAGQEIKAELCRGPGSGPVLRVHLSGQEVLAGGDGQGEDVVSADRGEPAAGRAAPQTQSGSARLVRLLPARLFVGDLLLPEPVPVAHGVAVAPTETPPVDLEGTAPRLLPRRLVAQRPGPGVVRPGKGRHDPLSLSRFDHSYALADFWAARR